jgi:hypothetical protein
MGGLAGVAFVVSGVGAIEVGSNLLTGKGVVQNLNDVFKKVGDGLNGPNEGPPKTPADKLPKWL